MMAPSRNPTPLRIVAFGRLVGLTVVTSTLFAQAALAQPQGTGMMGILTPQREVSLEPSIEGQLVQVLVRIGDEVAEGDVVAVLDDEVWRRDVEAAQARLEAAEAEHQLAATQLRIAEETVDRQRRLLEQQAISREAVRTAEQQVELAAAAARQAEALVRQQNAALDQIQVRLRQTRIRAPFAGRIAERYRNPGMTISPGTAIVRLISSHELVARFAAPVESAANLATGAGVAVVVPNLDRNLPGTISQVGTEIDAASGMIIGEAVVLLPEDWDGPPLSGQTVRVHLTD